MAWEYYTTYRGIDIYAYMPGATNFLAYINGGVGSNMLSVVMGAIDAYLTPAPEPEPEPEPDPRIPQFIETYRGVNIYYIPYFGRYTAKTAEGYSAVGYTLPEIRAEIDRLLAPPPPPATTLSISLAQIPPIEPSTSLTFTGRLKRPDTGAFISGQTIAVEHPPGTAVKTGVTDSSGTYGITITAPPTSGTYPYRTRFAGSSGLSASQSGTLGIGIEAPNLAILAVLGFLAYKLLVK